ncbi:MAG: hypothetical protein F6K47_02450 [Symploca sp. SIO2E6]|nr:hypothetical protein [Symploca sp. SIO2E6]
MVQKKAGLMDDAITPRVDSDSTLEPSLSENAITTIQPKLAEESPSTKTPIQQQATEEGTTSSSSNPSLSENATNILQPKLEEESSSTNTPIQQKLPQSPQPQALVQKKAGLMDDTIAPRVNTDNQLPISDRILPPTESGTTSSSSNPSLSENAITTIQPKLEEESPSTNTPIPQQPTEEGTTSSTIEPLLSENATTTLQPKLEEESSSTKTSIQQQPTEEGTTSSSSEPSLSENAITTIQPKLAEESPSTKTPIPQQATEESTTSSSSNPSLSENAITTIQPKLAEESSSTNTPIQQKLPQSPQPQALVQKKPGLIDDATVINPSLSENSTTTLQPKLTAKSSPANAVVTSETVEPLLETATNESTQISLPETFPSAANNSSGSTLLPGNTPKERDTPTKNLPQLDAPTLPEVEIQTQTSLPSFAAGETSPEISELAFEQTTPTVQARFHQPDTEITVAQLLSADHKSPALPTVLDNLAQLSPLGHSNSIGQSAVGAKYLGDNLSVKPKVYNPNAANSDGLKTIQRMPAATVNSSTLNEETGFPNRPSSMDVPTSWSNIAELLGQSTTTEPEAPVIQRPSASSTDTPTSWSNIAELLGESTPTEPEVPVIQRRIEQRKSVDSQPSIIQRYPEEPAEELVFTPEGFRTVNAETANRTNQRDSLIQTKLETTEQQPVSEVISSVEPTEDDTKEDSQSLEILAREIYSLIKQRLAIEKERQGSYNSDRLPW